MHSDIEVYKYIYNNKTEHKLPFALYSIQRSNRKKKQLQKKMLAREKHVLGTVGTYVRNI